MQRGIPQPIAMKFRAVRKRLKVENVIEQAFVNHGM
jgi:hypothetical protein